PAAYLPDMVQTPKKTKPRLFLVDAYALIYRAFFALIQRPLITTRGENTSAAYGFTRWLLKIMNEHDPDYVAVVVDAGTSQRKERYPEYKATREKMPDELRTTLPRIWSIIEGFRIPIITLADHEADDVIATMALQAVKQDVEAVIVSGDKDFYQLIRPGISLLNPGRGGNAMVEEEWIDTRNASERLGVPPHQVADYLALIGDSSDNIPGARGIGPKTAAQLIAQFGSVEQILERADEVTHKRSREALIACADDIRLSKELVTILEDLPVELKLAELRVQAPDRDRLRQLFVDLEFHTLVRDYAPTEEATAREYPRKYSAVADTAGVADLVRRARELGYIAIDIETSSSSPLRGELVGISIGFVPGEAFYLPLRHRSAGLGLDDVETRNLPPLDSQSMRPLVDLLEDPGIRKIGHNLKHDLLVLRRVGIELRGLDFDTMVASYVLDPGRRDHDVDSLALALFDMRTTTLEELCGKGKDRVSIAECSVERVTEYAGEDVDVTLRLAAKLQPQLPELALERLYREIEMPLIPVLAAMEGAGIRIDPVFFNRYRNKLAQDLHLLQEEIFKLAGHAFNISSPPQLRTVLFDELKLPVARKTKTGYSTDAAVLEELAQQGHPLPRLLLEYRQIDKLKGTYADALPALVNPETGRIHTTFNQVVAATGRLSSSDPNLQNIPIRTDLGVEIRKGFIPADGFVFVAADYSQIELRILAHLSRDELFMEPFLKGIDVHKQTAAVVFGVDLENVSGQMRGAAKTINFATVYGIGPMALSQKLGTRVAEAKTFIEQYFKRFPGVRRYLDDQIEHARKHGFVETLIGRRRYIPEIHSNNYNMREFGARAATNAPVQGSAADIIKIAMINIQRTIEEQQLRTRMLLQVHDELVFEVPESEVADARVMVKQLMESALQLRVPLEVATGVGNNWYECK
ncbi:MAG: DNA polymerase I, partial [Gemmatimonadota bacterium]